MNKLFKYISDLKISIYICSILFFILPFLILCFFANPYFDDFYHAALLFKLGFIKAQIFWYENWSGRYIANALASSVNPLIVKSLTGYKLTVFLYSLIFWFVLYRLFKEVFEDVISGKEIILIYLSFLFILYFIMPSSQSLYWMESIYIYEIPNLLFLIFLIILIRRIKNKLFRDIHIQAFAIIIVIMIAGMNETSMVLLIEFLSALIIYSIIKNRKADKFYFILLICSLLSAAIVLLSPGNEERSFQFPDNKNFSFSLYNSILSTAEFFKIRFINSPLMIFIILLSPLFFKLIRSDSPVKCILRVQPIFTFITILAMVFSGYFISYWATNSVILNRTLNVVNMFFLTGIFFLSLNLLYYLRNYFNLIPKKFQLLTEIVLVISILLYIPFSKNNIINSIKDFYHLKPLKFNDELQKRYEFIIKSKDEHLKIDKIHQVPKSFNFVDITSDTSKYHNQCYALFFNKKSISIKDNDTAIIHH